MLIMIMKFWIIWCRQGQSQNVGYRKCPKKPTKQEFPYYRPNFCSEEFWSNNFEATSAVINIPKQAVVRSIYVLIMKLDFISDN